MKTEKTPRNHTGKSSRAALLKDKPEAVEFLKLNAPYMLTSNIARAMGESSLTIVALAELLGIDLSDDAKEPRAGTIRRHQSFLPIDTQITQWTGGTSIHLKSDLPGNPKILRHYAI